MRLKNKTILITAAGQGMGRAAALACAAEGAEVIATDIRAELLESLASEAPQIETRLLDVTDGEAVARVFTEIPDLDGLFNVAGFVHQGSILELSDEDWAFSLDLNVTAMVRTIRAGLPGMLRRAEATGSAAILNMASMASSIKGFSRRTAYGATKAAVIGLTKGVAVDYVGRGIRCNALCPGTVDTPSVHERIAAAADPVQAEKDFIARQPLGRLGRVEEISPLVVYLLSDESRFVTGQPILIDGGATI